MGYIENLKLTTAEANRLRDEEARAKRPAADPRIVCEVPLLTQVRQYLQSQPPIMREKPISLIALRAQLLGRYNARPSAGDLGIALRALNFRPTRNFTKAGAGRRYWLPPT